MRSGAVKQRIVQRAGRTAAAWRGSAARGRGGGHRHGRGGLLRSARAPPGPLRQDRRGRRGERVRRRDRPGRRQVRPGQRHHVQPQHRPAHLRGEPRRRPRGERGPAHRAERRRLRHVHEHHRERRARAAAARSSTCSSCSGCRTPPPTPTCGTTRPRCRRWRTRSPPTWPPSSRRTRPTSRRTRRPSSPPSTPGRRRHRRLQDGLRGRPGGDDRAGGRLPAGGALGADNLTPWTFQADIMNGVDPSPQDVAAQKALFTGHKVKVFLYNQQVTDPLTESLITLAEQNRHPGRRRVRDDACAGIRLPDLDADRGAGPAQGGRGKTDRAPVRARMQQL